MADDIKLPPLAQPQVPILEAEPGLDNIRRLRRWCERIAAEHARAAVLADRAGQYPLPDDLFPDSKDWLAGDYAARVEWLHAMYEKKRAEVDALATASERIAAFEKAVCNALPGNCYMDPPDGGDVPLADQLSRMARDAARYRWLARKVSAHGICDGWQFGFPTAISLPAPALAMRDPEAALGQAIDAAIAEQERHRSYGHER